MSAESLISAVEQVLMQGQLLLGSVDPEDYTQKTEGSSLGAHYRHVLDHFSCFLDGLSTGVIDYDQRRRDTTVEESTSVALAFTESLMNRFRNLPTEVMRQECLVIYSVGYDDKEPQPVQSNVAREVMFCVGHAIHHYAILKLLCAAQSIRLPYEFGVAPSTLKHQSLAAR